MTDTNTLESSLTPCTSLRRCYCWFDRPSVWSSRHRSAHPDTRPLRTHLTRGSETFIHQLLVASTPVVELLHEGHICLEWRLAPLVAPSPQAEYFSVDVVPVGLDVGSDGLPDLFQRYICLLSSVNHLTFDDIRDFDLLSCRRYGLRT